MSGMTTQDHPLEQPDGTGTDEVATDEIATDDSDTGDIATEDIATEDIATEDIATGDIVIDAALRDLSQVPADDLDAQIEAAEAVQRTLQGRLADLGE